MDFTIAQPVLEKALKEASKATSSRSTLPILQYVLLIAGNGQLQINATDLAYGLTVFASARITTEGAIAIPARAITDLVQTISATEELHLKLSEDGFTLHLECSETKAKFKGLSADEFPLIPQSNPDTRALSIKASDLAAAINLVSYAASTDESRQVLTAIHIKYADSKIVFESADGYRMSLFGIDIAGQEPFEWIIPAKALVELAHIMHGVDDTVRITTSANNNTVIFETDRYVLSTQFIAGSYPDLQRVIPTTTRTHATVSRKLLLQAVKRALIFGRDKNNIVVFDLDADANNLTISAEAETGDGFTTLPTPIEGEQLKIALNGTFINAMLGALDVPEVMFSLTNAKSPALFKAIGEAAFTHVIMPMML